MCLQQIRPCFLNLLQSSELFFILYTFYMSKVYSKVLYTQGTLWSCSIVNLVEGQVKCNFASHFSQFNLTWNMEMLLKNFRKNCRTWRKHNVCLWLYIVTSYGKKKYFIMSCYSSLFHFVWILLYRCHDEHKGKNVIISGRRSKSALISGRWSRSATSWLNALSPSWVSRWWMVVSPQ